VVGHGGTHSPDWYVAPHGTIVSRLAGFYLGRCESGQFRLATCLRGRTAAGLERLEQQTFRFGPFVLPLLLPVHDWGSLGTNDGTSEPFHEPNNNFGSNLEHSLDPIDALGCGQIPSSGP
jgi:hypothetical protein